MSGERTILLNPGPVTLSDRVRRSLQQADLCHREPEFAALQQGIRSKLLAVYGLDPDDWAAVLLTGSGTAAVEAMIGSLVPRGQRVVIGQNGVYGERMASIAGTYGIGHRCVVSPWTEALDFAALERAAADEAAQVALVQHETTTGRLNDLDRFAERSDAPLLLDGVSSFGAEAIDFERWHVAACAATANKCLHGIPGAAFVIVRRRALTESSARSVYLDLARYCAQQDVGGTPFTQSVQAFYALDAALDEFLEGGGWQARRQRYRTLLAAVDDHLEALGVEPLLPVADRSCVLHAYRLPEGTAYATLHAALKRRGFVIYAGQGALAESIFRIATMGDIRDADVERLLGAFSDALQ